MIETTADDSFMAVFFWSCGHRSVNGRREKSTD